MPYVKSSPVTDLIGVFSFEDLDISKMPRLLLRYAVGKRIMPEFVPINILLSGLARISWISFEPLIFSIRLAVISFCHFGGFLIINISLKI